MKATKTEIDNAIFAFYNSLASIFFLHASEPQTEFDKSMIKYFQLIEIQLPNLINHCHQSTVNSFLDFEIEDPQINFLANMNQDNII